MKTPKKTPTPAPKKAPGRPKKPAAEKLEQFSIRLPPKLKFGLELLARAQHRSLSQAVEWALLVGLNSYEVDRENDLTLGALVEKVWSEQSEMRRLLVIYNWVPALLPFDDLVACELIEKCVEREELFDYEPPDSKLGRTADERQAASEKDQLAFLAEFRRVQQEREKEEGRFYEFCELLWPAIKEVAVARANAGQTQKVSLTRALGFGVLGTEVVIESVLRARKGMAPLTLSELHAMLEKEKPHPVTLA